MAILKKKTKLNMPVFIKRISVTALLKKAAIPLIAVCIILLVYGGLRSIFLKSSYFKISKVEIIPQRDSLSLDESEVLKSCLEKNIFTLDIKNIAHTIHTDYPELRNVKVMRVMPDVLRVEITPRIPVALIKTYKYFPVDEKSVILSPVEENRESLPLISGISVWGKPKIGEVFRSNRLKSALHLLKSIDGLNLLKIYRVKEIDVSNMRNMMFSLNNGLEVRIGYGNLNEKLRKLSMVLKDPNIDVNNLNYIDLRFEDAVLGPK